MDQKEIIENGLLLAATIIGGMMSIAFAYIINCAKRQNARNRKVLKKKWLSNELQNQLFPWNNIAKTYQLSQRHGYLNLSWNNSGQRKNISEPEEMVEIADNSQKTTELSPTSTYVTHINVNNDKLEEQTAVAEIDTTSTQMTSTFTSVQSRGDLNHMMFKSNSISETATGNKELLDGLESNADNKSVLKEKSWNSTQHYPQHCHDENLQIPIKYKKSDKKMLEKAMIKEYKLEESVIEMVQKYEKSRVESEQDTYNFQKNKQTTLSM